MTNRHPDRPLLPHHSLRVYRIAIELLGCVRDANIKDVKLRDQAMRAAKSVALNIAEAAGRVSPADKARVYAIARGEAMEASAALEIASIAGDCTCEAYEACLPHAEALFAILTVLAR
jgi:four helix bundle protein